MLDVALLTLKAGDGGHGRVSFRREKYIPKGGPDGGRGGDGGNLILRASRHLSTLDAFAGKTELVAPSGQMGGKKKMSGHAGEDLIVEVPVGTIVWLLAENEEAYRQRKREFQPEGSRQYLPQLEQYFVEKEGQHVPGRESLEVSPVEGVEAVPESIKNLDLRPLKQHKRVEFTEHGQEFLIAGGGAGGRGNESFKGPANTTPLEAEYGGFGAEVTVLLEARLLADVGLVGFPNAGKSTLLSVVSSARPRVADYPFTTLDASIGVWPPEASTSSEPGREIVVADIPGLIEQASQGKGLGYDFLRHVENCQVLCFVIAATEEQLFSGDVSQEALAQSLLDQYQVLKKELEEYGQGLADKPSLVVINKVDILNDSQIAAIKKLFDAHSKKQTFLISGATQQGLKELRSELVKLMSEV